MPDNSSKNKKNESTSTGKSIEVKKQKTGKTKISSGKNNKITVKVKDFEYSV